MKQPVNMNVPLKDTQPIICENCGHNVFVEGLMLRKVSKFVTGTTQDAIMPIPTFACVKCGHVNEAFLPKDKNEIK
jgi:DNA-directed RNA polymerase subunit RPC12/RpoP